MMRSGPSSAIAARRGIDAGCSLGPPAPPRVVFRLHPENYPSPRRPLSRFFDGLLPRLRQGQRYLHVSFLELKYLDDFVMRRAVIRCWFGHLHLHTITVVL